MILSTQQFFSRIQADPQSGCMLWMGAVGSNGYGRFRYFDEKVGRTRVGLAHRISYELQVGPIPAGLVLDHLCRVRRCVAPGHLEPVTTRENLLRGETVNAANAARETCPWGHEYRYDGRQRRCPQCIRDQTRERMRRYRAEGRPYA